MVPNKSVGFPCHWYAGRVLGILWILPATILVWVFYILPMYLIVHDLVFVRWAQFGVAEFVLAEKGLESWHARLWRDWAGWAGPCVFIWRGDPHATMSSTRIHELEHVRQQFYCGIFFYPVYLFMSIFIWIFLRNKSAYLDNPFEVAARRAAGQTVTFPPGYWKQNPGKRWPWW